MAYYIHNQMGNSVGSCKTSVIANFSLPAHHQQRRQGSHKQDSRYTAISLDCPISFFYVAFIYPVALLQRVCLVVN